MRTKALRGGRRFPVDFTQLLLADAGDARDRLADRGRKIEQRDDVRPTTKKASAKKVPAKKPNAAPKAPRAKAAKSDGKLSQLDAAVKVLTEAGEPMTTKAMIDAMAAKGYWTSPGGQTPHATLYSALLREIQKKGTEARFVKVDRGQFTLNDGTTPAARPARKKSKGAKAQDQSPAIMVPHLLSE